MPRHMAGGARLGLGTGTKGLSVIRLLFRGLGVYGLLFILPFHFMFLVQTYYTLLHTVHVMHIYTIELIVEPIIYHSRISRTTIHRHIFTIWYIHNFSYNLHIITSDIRCNGILRW